MFFGFQSTFNFVFAYQDRLSFLIPSTNYPQPLTRICLFLSLHLAYVYSLCALWQVPLQNLYRTLHCFMEPVYLKHIDRPHFPVEASRHSAHLSTLMVTYVSV